jgi:hypothetical protein
MWEEMVQLTFHPDHWALFVLFPSLSAAGSSVVILDDDNFDSIVGQAPGVFVEFFGQRTHDGCTRFGAISTELM